MFEGIDLDSLWVNKPLEDEFFQSAPCSDEIIREVECELGYKLPASYIWLMKRHNGGALARTRFPLKTRLPLVGNAALIGYMYGIGREKDFSLCGRYGVEFLIDAWDFPPIGVAIGQGLSGCHEVYFLDYRECGPQGEPKVVHVDQEADFRITVLADDFESFIRGLVPDHCGE